VRNLWIVDVQRCCIVCHTLAFLDFLGRDFAVDEGVNEALYALQPTPLCLAVSFFKSYTSVDNPESFDFTVVAARIAFAGVLNQDCSLA
jgi:hypothetical protein